MKTTFSSKDFNINWPCPDAAANFGKVYFGTKGLGGLGGQVVIKCPKDEAFALTVFETERAVNEKLDRTYGVPCGAKYLGDVAIDDSTLYPLEQGG